jgi:hypothetical protein
MAVVKNTGKPYESLTLRVFDEILRQNRATTYRIEHDLVLQGKEASHQIDVLWEFDLGGIRYLTIVQCKDWNYSVKQEHLFSFKTVLGDIPGQPRGVFVTRHGFQEGAIEFARKNGIILYVLREPVDADWEGYLKTVGVEMNLYVPVVHSYTVATDKEWVKEEKRRLGLPEEQRLVALEVRADEVVFEAVDGQKVCTALEILKKLTAGAEESPPHEVRFALPEGTFLKTGDLALPRVKVLEFVATVSCHILRDKFEIDLTSCVGMILQGVIDGSERSFTKDLRLLPLRDDPEK